MIKLNKDNTIYKDKIPYSLAEEYTNLFESLKGVLKENTNKYVNIKIDFNKEYSKNFNEDFYLKEYRFIKSDSNNTYRLCYIAQYDDVCCINTILSNYKDIEKVIKTTIKHLFSYNLNFLEQP